MKAILKFDLNDQSDNVEYKQCVKAKEMAIIIFDLYYTVPRKLQFDIDEAGANAQSVLDGFNDALDNLLSQYNVNIEELNS